MKNDAPSIREQMHIPPLYLPVYAILLLYFGYALRQYSVHGGEYNTAFWVIHGVTHEVGHAVASWLPEVIHVLAGSLAQWLTPIACGVYFLRGQEKHAALVALAWLGFSLLDSAAYMRDAIEQELPLVAPFAGPDAELIHDWNCLFSRWGILQYAHDIGDATAWLGIAIVILAMLLIVCCAIPLKTTRGEDDPNGSTFSR